MQCLLVGTVGWREKKGIHDIAGREGIRLAIHNRSKSPDVRLEKVSRYKENRIKKRKKKTKARMETKSLLSFGMQSR